MNKKMNVYEILYHGDFVGKTTAVSPEKAKVNYWWIHDKQCNKFTRTQFAPSDYEAKVISDTK